MFRSPHKKKWALNLTVRHAVALLLVTAALAAMLRVRSFTLLRKASKLETDVHKVEEVEDDSYAEDVRTATQRLENKAFQALTSWPTLPTAILDVEGSLLVPLVARASKDRRVVLIFDFDPVMGAMGLSFGEAKAGEQQVQKWVDTAVARSIGETAKDSVLAALNVEVVWSSHLLNRSQWFVLVPQTDTVMSVHAKAIKGETEIEHKQLSNSRVMLYTSTSIMPLVKLLLLWYRELEGKGGNWGVKTIIAYSYDRWGLGGLEAEVSRGLFWPCMYVVDEVMRFPTVTHAYDRILSESKVTTSDSMPLSSESVSYCKQSFESQKLSGDFSDGVFEVGH